MSPAATEICNGVDDDCDGTTDPATSADATTWFHDADGDTYGDPTDPSAACTAPAAHVADDTDCDDTTTAVSPAAAETCNLVDDDCDGEVDEASASDAATWFADTDVDGFGDPGDGIAACYAPAGRVLDDTDCDDSTDAVSPADTESCNGIDDDCDGSTDESDAAGATTWFADVDGDTYGDSTASQPACTAPSNHVADDTDCDDAAAAVSPAAVETCNGVDDDCDAATDEPDASDASTWFADDDGDSFGDAASTTPACAQPAGYVADATDCDDTSADALPGGTELCDGVDNDCDGDTDEADAADATSHFADTDGDGFGDASSSVVACAAPAGFVSDGTDCDDAASATHPAADELCNGIDDDCDATVDEPSAVDAPTWFFDADSDTYGDPLASVAGCSAPAAFVSNGLDCDDGATAVHPAADEICNLLDDDCDGTVDVGAIDASTWYLDTDLDGYGDPGSSASACAAPAGYVAAGTDCDDDDDDISPADPEMCNGADDDCDGSTDEADALDAITWYADDDDDGYGDPLDTTDACTLPAGHGSDSQDCDDADGAVHPGQTDICDLIDNDCDGFIDEDAAGDTDGDGLCDDIDDDDDGDGCLDVDDGTPLAGPSPDFTEDFSSLSFNPTWTMVNEGVSDSTPDWAASSGYAVETGNAHDFNRGNDGAVDIEGTWQWAPGSMFVGGYLQASMYYGDDDGMGLMWAVEDANNYYRFVMDKQRSYARLMKVEGGAWTTLDEDLSFKPAKNEWHEARVERFGTTVSVYLDEALLLSGLDDPCDDGAVGLFSWAMGNARFDDIRIADTPQTCGDGSLDTDEACDDGNHTDGDGCDFACRAE